ncbi:MAG: HEAT repeat domain-containing protein [Myxococcales bacterium]|nr:HEAT repeat domain-containing protein [Myxococcota bacterium]MDW8281021.1 HEAT repeat domain-containing protein [Myxococcales bacterium]
MAGLLLVLLVVASGCQRGEQDLRGVVQLAAHERGEPAQRAISLLARAGPAALPAIEAGLHAAPPHGRRNLVVALRRLGLIEAVPLLGHLAAFDDDPVVRTEARFTLGIWVAAGGRRGRAAAAALQKADEVQGSEATG